MKGTVYKMEIMIGFIVGLVISAKIFIEIYKKDVDKIDIIW